MRETVSISLPPELSRKLQKHMKRTGKGRSEIIQESLRRQLAVDRFRALREKALPRAQAAGIFTDEDAFAKLT